MVSHDTDTNEDSTVVLRKPYGAVDTPKINHKHSNDTNHNINDITEPKYDLNERTNMNHNTLQADGNMRSHHSHSDDESVNSESDTGSGSDADIENSTLDKSIISTISKPEKSTDVVYNKKGNIKQRRVSLACLNCKLAKTRCDNERPCKRCIATGRVNTCVNGKKQKRGRKKGKRKLLLANTINSNDLNHTLNNGNNGMVMSTQQSVAANTASNNIHATLMKMAELSHGNYDAAVASQQAAIALALAQQVNHDKSNVNTTTPQQQSQPPLLIAPQPIPGTSAALAQSHAYSAGIGTPNQYSRGINGFPNTYGISPSQQYKSSTGNQDNNTGNNNSPPNPYNYLTGQAQQPAMSPYSQTPYMTAYNQLLAQNSNMYPATMYGTVPFQSQQSALTLPISSPGIEYNPQLFAQPSRTPYQSITPPFTQSMQAPTPIVPSRMLISQNSNKHTSPSVIQPNKLISPIHPYNNLTPVINSTALFRAGSSTTAQFNDTTKSIWLQALHQAATNVLNRLNITITQLQNAPYTFPTHRVTAFTWCSKFLSDCINIATNKPIQPFTAEPNDLERDKTTIVALESQKAIQHDMPVGLVCICLWPHPFTAYTNTWCNNSMSTQLGYNNNSELTKIIHTIQGIATIYSYNNLEQTLFKFIEAVCSNQMRYELQSKYINSTGVVVDAVETNNIQYSSSGSGIPLWITSLIKLDDINNSILINNNNIQNIKTLQSNANNTFKPIQFDGVTTLVRQQSALSLIADTAIKKDNVNSTQLPDLQRQPVHLYNSSSSS